VLFGWPRYMVICSGSNITERAREASIAGFIERLSLRSASKVMVNNYPEALKTLDRLRLRNCVFLPYPYPVDRVVGDAISPHGEQEKRLVFLLASNLDWGAADSDPKRNSTKGNDRFIKAFIRACRNGLSAHCIVLERGPDILYAKKIISEEKAEQYFSWQHGLSRKGFHDLLKKCDIVVDQFDIGGYGGIAIEAMSFGKPVIAYIEKKSNSYVFQETIPIINARSEDEIYDCLALCADGDYLDMICKRAQSFVDAYFDPDQLGKRYLSYVVR
jgi:glycosyltransferase involved in cell wall biosynthesis